mgnify:CR=1 FL=1
MLVIRPLQENDLDDLYGMAQNAGKESLTLNLKEPAGKKLLKRLARKAAVRMDGKLHMFETLEEAKQLYDYETQG